MIRTPHVPLAVLSTLATLVTASLAIAQKPTKAESKATSKHTTTHRVVVVDGETIVDERTVNGRRVPSKGVDAPPPDLDVEEMIRELRERMRRARGEDLPSVGKVKKSTHTRRVVVKNGEVVVDEETRDGKPVKRDNRKDVDGDFEDLDEFDRRIKRGLRRDLRKAEKKPGKIDRSPR